MLLRTIGAVFAMLTERRIHKPVRNCCDRFVGPGGIMGTLGG
jgi:hypothetical protein